MNTFLSPEVKEVSLRYFEGLDCARSLTAAILVRYGQWADLLSLDCLPLHYCTDVDYYRSACATDLLRKLAGRVDGLDPALEARQKWRESEYQCFLTNRRIYAVTDGGFLPEYPPQFTECLLEILEQTRKQMWWLLGPGPDSFDGAFGPGATLSDTSRACTILHKMSTTPTLTPSALFYLVPWTGTAWARANAYRGEDVSVVRSNSYFTVPKTARTDRSCAKEPSINGFYQLGLGRVMRAALRKRGIDLENGQDVHRRVACSSSRDESFCTIDLSSASDTICTALVRAVTPPKWLSHLEDLRSTATSVDGKVHILEKFSSMGNGFTFELETALFASIVLSVDPRLIPGVDFWVYGDDIIIPPQIFSEVRARLTILGFKLNPKKTFITGPFRESCGGDYFNGSPVRAFFLKKLPDEPHTWISFANGLARVIENLDQMGYASKRLRSAWFLCLDQLPAAIRKCRGPRELGDLVIHDREDTWSTRWRAQIRYLRVWRPARYRTVPFRRFDSEICMSGALYGLDLYPPHKGGMTTNYYRRQGVIPRNGVSGYKLGWAAYS